MPRPKKDVVHGTVDGYMNHACRCQQCRTAWAAYRRPRARKGFVNVRDRRTDVT